MEPLLPSPVPRSSQPTSSPGPRFTGTNLLVGPTWHNSKVMELDCLTYLFRSKWKPSTAAAARHSSWFDFSFFFSPLPHSPRFRKRSCRDLLSFSHKGIREVWRWCWVIRPGRQWALDQGSSRPFKFFGAGISEKAIHSRRRRRHRRHSSPLLPTVKWKRRRWFDPEPPLQSQPCIQFSKILNSTLKGRDALKCKTK